MGMLSNCEFQQLEAMFFLFATVSSVHWCWLTIIALQPLVRQKPAPGLIQGPLLSSSFLSFGVEAWEILDGLSSTAELPHGPEELLPLPLALDNLGAGHGTVMAPCSC